jgi:dTMP kinase
MGKLIVFEGGHGSGKTTLALSLSDYLIRQGKKVILTKEPFRQDIRSIIEKLSIDKRGLDKDLSILYLLAADRYLHTKYIQGELRNNDFIISDRYIFIFFRLSTNAKYPS